MFKSVLFLFLYAVAGVSSWGAYTFIAEKDSSISSLSKIASQITPDLALHSATKTKTNNTISRWKDYKGNWNYEKAPFTELTFNDYSDELESLSHIQIESKPKVNTPVVANDSRSLFTEIEKLFEHKK